MLSETTAEKMNIQLLTVLLANNDSQLALDNSRVVGSGVNMIALNACWMEYFELQFKQKLIIFEKYPI